jgi:hypothetical protein
MDGKIARSAAATDGGSRMSWRPERCHSGRIPRPGLYSIQPVGRRCRAMEKQRRARGRINQLLLSWRGRQRERLHTCAVATKRPRHRSSWRCRGHFEVGPAADSFRCGSPRGRPCGLDHGQLGCSSPLYPDVRRARPRLNCLARREAAE